MSIIGIGHKLRVMLSMTWSRTWQMLVALPVWMSLTNWSSKIDRD